MLRLFAAIAALTSAQLCSAQCPLAQTIVSTWGISFSGFTKPLPRLSEAQRAHMAGQHFLLVRLPNSRGAVADGFEHEALLDLPRNRAWIARHGGFVGVDEWYGPFTLPDATVIGCDVERYVAPTAAAHH